EDPRARHPRLQGGALRRRARGGRTLAQHLEPRMKNTNETNEYRRLYEPYNTPIPPWHRWGPYVSERAWGTVREDYSPDGNAWDYFPHDKARSKAYRWGEDGLAGICDRYQVLCFALAL